MFFLYFLYCQQYPVDAILLYSCTTSRAPFSTMAHGGDPLVEPSFSISGRASFSTSGRAPFSTWKSYKLGKYSNSNFRIFRIQLSWPQSWVRPTSSTKEGWSTTIWRRRCSPTMSSTRCKYSFVYPPTLTSLLLLLLLLSYFTPYRLLDDANRMGVTE